MLKRKTLSLALASLMLSTTLAVAQPICGALSESALFMVDYSGSMMKANDKGDRAIEQSKELLLRLVQSLPQEAKLAMGVTSFAPHAILVSPQIYSTQELVSKIEYLPEKMEVMGRHTNLGEGLMGYKARVEKLLSSPKEADRKLASQMANDAHLIILTDGGNDNRGREVQAVLDDFVQSLPNVRLAVIAFSNESKQEDSLMQLAKSKDIALYWGESLLNEPQKLEQFIHTELYYPCEEIHVTLSSDVLFEFDQSRLTTKGQKTLEELAKTLLKNMDVLQASDTQFEISAHTDKIGSQKYNQRLSEKRLATVLETLEAYGVPRGFFAQHKAMGEQLSVTKNTCQGLLGAIAIQCLQPDRRVEIRVLKNKR